MTEGASFEKAWDVVKDEEEGLPPEAPFHSTEEKRLNEQPLDSPIEYDGSCPHCGANASELAGIGALEGVEHDLIDYGLDGDYYQTYKCFNCSGEWENRYSFSGVVKR